MALSKLVAEFSQGELEENKSGIVDPITFLEAEWGFGLGKTAPQMYPTQRFIIKVYYSMDLDNSANRDIVIKDMFNEEILHVFNEQEYFDYLVKEGRINLTDIGTIRENLQLVIGRRGSKTTTISFIYGYELYRNLSMYSPHDYYGIMPDDLIEAVSVSTDEGNAKNFFDRVVGNLLRSPFFADYMKKPKETEVYFQTRRDIDKYGRGGKASIRFRAATCSAKALRGQNNFLVCLDEAAFFFKDTAGKKASNQSDRSIYDAVSPSLAKFNHPDGSPAGRSFMISSPGDTDGLFYSEYERSFDSSMQDLVMIQIPSWEMDPTLSSKYLRAQHAKGPNVYKAEFGAQFLTAINGWIDDPNILLKNVNNDLGYREYGALGVDYFMGIDVGLRRDGTALTLSHVEWVQSGDNIKPVIVVDWSMVRYASVEGLPYFEPKDVVEWIKEVDKRYNIVASMMDQHMGLAIKPDLDRAGLSDVRMVDVTNAINSNIYQNFMAKLIGGNVIIPGIDHGETEPPKEDGKYTELISELFQLNAENSGKYITKVFVPEKVGHDDLSDSLARSIYLATEYINEESKRRAVVNHSTGIRKGVALRQSHLASRFSGSAARRVPGSAGGAYYTRRGGPSR